MVSEEDEEARRRTTRDRIEETFRRYEEAERPPPERVPVPPTPRIAETRAATIAPEKAVTRVELPPPRVVPTGIPGFDDSLEGGLPDRSLILVTGEAGSHHTTFVHQLLNNHLIEGGKVAYYTMETPNIDVREEMAAYGWYLQDYVASGQWVFVSALTPDLQQLADLTPQQFLQGELRVTLSRGLNPLKTDLLNKIREERWTVLPLTHILQQFDFKEVVDLLLYWRLAIRSYGGIHIALLPQGVHDDKQVNQLKTLADGVLEFLIREGPREFDNVLLVRKLRRTLRRARPIRFSVVDDGITIDTAARIM